MTKMKKIGTPAKATIVDGEAAEPGSDVQVEAPVVPATPSISVEVVLDPHEATLAQLGQERIMNAQLHLQNRQKELEGLLMQVKTKYEEGGKFALTAIDIPRGVVTRHPVG